MNQKKFTKKELEKLADKHCFMINDPLLWEALLYEFNFVLPQKIAQFNALPLAKIERKDLPNFSNYQKFREDRYHHNEILHKVFFQNKKRTSDGYFLIAKK